MVGCVSGEVWDAYQKIPEFWGTNQNSLKKPSSLEIFEGRWYIFSGPY